MPDDLSNWFVRRSRRRFWKSEDDTDKTEAYQTLAYVLTYLSLIMAPFVPFLAEELYQQMTGASQLSARERAKCGLQESVHLCDWPVAGAIDSEIQTEMARTRQVIAEALALRMRRAENEEQIKIRQPLASLGVVLQATATTVQPLPDFYTQMIADEVNVKAVKYMSQADWQKMAAKAGMASSQTADCALCLDKNITSDLAAEGFARELVRVVQSARKKAGLQVDDRIKLRLSWADKQEQGDVVPAAHRDNLQREVLATELNSDGNYAYDEIAKVEDREVLISLEAV